METTHDAVAYKLVSVSILNKLGGEGDNHVVVLKLAVLGCVAQHDEARLAGGKLVLLIELDGGNQLTLAVLLLCYLLDGIGVNVLVILGNVPDVVGHGHHVKQVEGEVREHDRFLLFGNNLHKGPCGGVVGHVANHVSLVTLGPEGVVLLVRAGLRYEVKLGVAHICNVVGHRLLADGQIDIVTGEVAQIVSVVHILDGVVFGALHGNKSPHSLGVVVGAETHAGAVKETPLGNGGIGRILVQIDG